MPPKAKGKKPAAASTDGDDAAAKLKPAQSLKLRHILCEKAAKHAEALEELKKGTPFDIVAEKYSEDKARHGGLLGWMPRNGMMGCFQENAFSIPESTTKEPVYKVIKSSHGWHIVMVHERK